MIKQLLSKLGLSIERFDFGFVQLCDDLALQLQSGSELATSEREISWQNDPTTDMLGARD